MGSSFALGPSAVRLKGLMGELPLPDERLAEAVRAGAPWPWPGREAALESREGKFTNAGANA